MVVQQHRKQGNAGVDTSPCFTSMLLQHPVDHHETLCDAVENTDEAKVNQLLKQGQRCRPNPQNKLTCLHIACQRGYLKIACDLIDHGFDIHALTKEYKTPLHEAVCRGHLDVARELLQRGASTEQKDIRSFTPLFIAAQNGDKQMVKTLLEFNASVKAKNALGQSPLHVARNASIIEILASKGLDIDIKGDHGGTPLHCAARDFDEELIQTLLDLGADPTVRNKDGNTPRDLAEPQTWQENKTALKLLREAEKKFDKNLAANSQDCQKVKENHGEVPVVIPLTVVDLENYENKASESHSETPRDPEVSSQKKIPGKNTAIQTESIDSNSTPQLASYQQERKAKGRCLGDISDKEMGRMARGIDKKQAKQLKRLVPKELKHGIEVDEKGNCRNQYFQLLKVARSRYREMDFEDFKKKIGVTRQSAYKMSHHDKIKLETDIQRLQLNRIRITNLALTTVLSKVASRDYYLLGIELGLSSEAMDEIHALTRELLAEKCHQTLRKAKERYPKKTCADIVRAFANLGHDYHKAMKLLEQSEHFIPIG